ncbi:MAG: hypothetical protein ACKVIH_07295 [Burkholderiales bacterium]
MNMPRFIYRVAAISAITSFLAMAGMSAALAQNRSVGSEAQQRYKEERAFCMSGQSHQDRATCLTEANNAYADARRGRLTSTGSTDYQANALARCQAQPPTERQDCIQLIQGNSSATGSVKGGGVIREIELPVR